MYLTDDICHGRRLGFKDGYVTVPEGNGLGIELDRNKIERYSQLTESHPGFPILEPSKRTPEIILPFPCTRCNGPF